MYLSLLKLDLTLLTTRRLLLDSYLLHQAICRAFPDSSCGGRGRVLYRLDVDTESRTANVLVQSQIQPAWEKAELLHTCLKEPPRTKPFNPVVAKGQKLYFRLRANPTIRRDGKRLGILREEDQIRWLNRKAAASGFTVLSCQVICEGIQKSTRPKDDTAQPLSFLSVRFDGVLCVEDPLLFVQCLESGIGSGKSMGFGLLSVAPLKE